MKVEFKDKEQSVTTEKNYDYTTWNVGDVVHGESYPETEYKFVGVVDGLHFFYNYSHPAPYTYNQRLFPTQKDFYTLVELKQKPKQDVVLTLEHDWEVALVTSLLGGADQERTERIVKNDLSKENYNEQYNTFNLLCDYCFTHGIHRKTISNIGVNK